MKGLGGIFLFVIFLVLISLRQLISLYVDWLWFEEVGYTQVFTISLFFKTVLAVLGGSIFALLIYANVRIAARLVRGIRFLDQENFLDLPRPELIDPLVQRLLLPAALVLGLFAAPQAASHWESFLLLLNPTSFGLEDPLYNRDLGFFVFQLPALRTLYNWLMTALAVSLALTAVVYVLYRGLQYSPRGIFLAPRARLHLLILIAALLAVKAAGYVLDSYDLLYASGGAAFGAGYTDVYVSLPALRILTVAALIAAALSAAQITRPGFAYLLVGIAGLVVIHVIGLSAAPAMVQRFRVVPNEVDSERPFIEHNIKFTRTAYGLDKIENEDFPADETLNAADLQRNDATIKNIRLWEHQPLLATYAQLQEIRTYYKFVDVDNDRYNIDGTYRQIMLSARELSHQHLPSRIWINEHLTYTHGYGVVFGPVNQVTPEGLPEFFIKDIPPVSDGSLKVTRPEIYYGELANDYVFVKSGARELDYPAGDQNIYTQYSGSGGVSIGSLWRKLIFSAHFATLRIVLSEDIVQESRILYQRQIQERVKKVLPFVTFDRDAYMVIAQGGRLFWMIDGYTTSDRFPYSAPIRRRGTNYIRNSVKAVVDAYNGTVDFYMSDPEDPIVQSYQKIFPQLFKPLEKMPEDLRAHIRYPEDLFTIQSQMYATYHMRDPQVFYNKEDLLSIPRQTVSGTEREMAPYYTIMRLPGETKEEFVLLLPFTPNNRDNMRAWLAARSDPPHYGKLIALDFPKAKLVYGPKQIDARIEQDAFISQQLSLWGQRGQVIRGSLLAIPIEKSLLYVQPLFLAAEKGSLPELKRVIVAFGNQIAMEETLDQSLQRVFGGKASAEPSPMPASVKEALIESTLAQRALEHFSRSQEFLRQGNWAGYGEEQKRLEALLREMQQRR
ncbi:MAG TPA: UPF0182 family protein [Candidatus Binatia bacterium]|nr:UPF0182 family protein [Candidatus Binatia bacterium]